MARSDRFLNACRLERADCVPVWFMRQAGRYMSEYRKIREKYGLLQMFKTPELAAEVTLQPIRALPVDAAIIFADILLPLEGMGIRIEFAEGEGPIIHNPVRTRADAEVLRVADPDEALGYVLKSLELVRAELQDQVPLIGFAGAPFTLASYVIEGGGSRNYLRTKQLMYGEPETWGLLMSRLTETLVEYLLAQVRAGAQAVQLFDSWVGCLSPADYRDYVLPYSRRLFLALRQAGIPSIHFGTGTGDLLPLMREAGGDVMGADWRISLDTAWQRIGPGVGIQGNLDPVALMAPWPVLQKRAKEILDRAAGRAGHIFNLGHGILPSTPVDSVRALAEFVHEYSNNKRPATNYTEG
ncbi:MAG TPA: uroporphyrinogen decarboxylase [Acidobacteriota bacterium]|nr:uroporphyrinogen decarboxylase [Acidobacteriota bacterium]